MEAIVVSRMKHEDDFWDDYYVHIKIPGHTPEKLDIESKDLYKKAENGVGAQVDVWHGDIVRITIGSTNSEVRSGHFSLGSLLSIAGVGIIIFAAFDYVTVFYRR
jgi:hypothetical protein